MKIGEVSFMIGIIVSILSGALTAFIEPGYIILVLVILGLIVGLMNITEKETNPFLIAGIALSATSLSGDILGVIPLIGEILAGIVRAIVVFVAPAILIVSLKAIYSMAKN